jgi:uncharacterized membrane protein YdbT with pleckstrin-like domain
MSGTSLIFEGKQNPKAFMNFWVTLAFWSLVSVGFLLPFTVLYGLVKFLKCKTTSYKVSHDHVVSEAGILSKTVNTLDLWRIRDIQFQQSLLQRMFKCCRIVLVTQDETNPIFLIEGVMADEGRKIFESLNSSIAKSRKDNRIVSVTA